jgi:hypothetical protein
MLLPFFLLAFFAYPSSDDYHLFMTMQSSAAPNYVVYMYQSWSGRFAGNLLAYLNPVSYRAIYLYFLLPFAGLSLMLLAVRHLLGTIMQPTLCRKDIWLCTMLAFACIVYLLPSPSNLFFWGTGVIYYAIPLSASLFSVSLFIREEKRVKKKLYTRALLSILVFVITGTNELLGISLLLLLAAWWAYSQGVLRQRFQPGHALYFFSIILGLVIVAAAPGNQTRISAFEEAMNPVFGLYAASKSMVFLMGWLLIHPAFLLCLLLLAAFRKQFTLPPSLLKTSSPAILYAAFFLSLLIPFAMFFTVCFMQGTLPPLRVFNLAVVFFAGLFALLWMAWLKRIESRKGIADLPAVWKNMLLALWFFLLIADFNISLDSRKPVFKSGLGSAWYELIFEADDFRQSALDREEHIRQIKAGGGKAAILKPLSVRPTTLYTGDLHEDPAHWTNRLYASYHRIDSVHLEP